MSILRGRFGDSVTEAFDAFASSLGIDEWMLAEDIRGSQAHATMLEQVGILEAGEGKAISDALATLLRDYEAGTWTPSTREEDVHMAVEAELISRLGDLGKKLHTARSRNDQVATDVRLWMKRHLRSLDEALKGLIEVLLTRCESDGQVLLPGYTHLQRGQPILLGHQLLAYAWAFHRDRTRVQAAFACSDLSPLGACAMAGTPHPIDRAATAELLEFSGLVPNAMDAVAARDHQQESTAACAICMTHLSRMAEELILWASNEFDFVRLSDSYTTGSSIMPQKRNPDAAELIRGKVGRVVGALNALMVQVKGLPMAYNRDLQEDREALFDAISTTVASVDIMAGMWRELTVRADRFEQELHGDFSLATELADHLVNEGVPFRDAHAIVGRMVQDCDARGVNLAALSQAEAADYHKSFSAGYHELLDPRKAAQRRTSTGGTAWVEIESQLRELRKLSTSSL